MARAELREETAEINVELQHEPKQPKSKQIEVLEIPIAMIPNLPTTNEEDEK